MKKISHAEIVTIRCTFHVERFLVKKNAIGRFWPCLVFSPYRMANKQLHHMMLIKPTTIYCSYYSLYPSLKNYAVESDSKSQISILFCTKSMHFFQSKFIVCILTLCKRSIDCILKLLVCSFSVCRDRTEITRVAISCEIECVKPTQ